MDGDARGGAALSVVSVVGVPIAFVGSGERLQDLEPFHADRVVSRVLGMGDVLSLIEKAEEAVSIEDAEKLEQKIRQDDFTLEDFRDQLRTIKKMGPLEQIIGMLPGMGGHQGAEPRTRAGRRQAAARVEAIINSMTPKERREPSADQRQPPQAHRQGQRHVGRRGEPPAEAVRPDEEDAQGAWAAWPASARSGRARQMKSLMNDALN